MRYFSTALAALVVSLSFSQFTTTALAASADQEVRAALDDLDTWLGQGANGDRWRVVLGTDSVRQELAKGDRANSATVARLTQAYAASAPGQPYFRFARLEKALNSWQGQLSQQPANLPEMVRATKGSYKPLSARDTSETRRQLAAAVQQLDRYLGRSATGQAWRKYLMLDELQAQLRAPTPNVDKLREIHGQLAANEEGLEMPIFSNVASTLKTYIDVTEASANAEAKSQYEAQMDMLATALENYSKKPNSQDAWVIGEILGRLESTRQAPQIAKAVRAALSHPNVYATVNEETAIAGFEQTVDDVGPLTDVILGAQVRGTTHTVGRVRGDLVPNNRQATVDAVLVGKAYSKSTSYKGKARVYTTGDTDLEGHKQFVFDKDGLKGLHPDASAETHTTINGTGASGHFHRLVSKIAYKKATEKKSQAEAIASDHAEDRLRNRMDDESRDTIADFNRDYNKKFRNPLVRHGAFPQQLWFQSSDHSLFVTALTAANGQLGAPAAPPDASASHAVTVRVHESAINNLGDTVLSGKTVTDTSVQKDAMDILGHVPDELKREPDDEPWSMTFVDDQPVSADFRNGGFALTVRIQSYTSGDRRFPGMNVTGKYRVERSGNRAKAVREGELDILPPGYTEGQRLTNQQVTLRALLKKRFDKLFKPEMLTKEVTPDGKWKNAGPLVITEIAPADNDWMTLGWDKEASANVASLPQDTPD